MSFLKTKNDILCLEVDGCLSPAEYKVAKKLI
jgi:hypothetical protein